jgi:F-type H+-transporting ATPase subunit epsilon
MKAFTLRLQDSTQAQEITGVTSFVGEDVTGSFGILAGHARMMTVLNVGLSRFRVDESPWQYLAMPGAVLYFHDNLLVLNTRRFLLDADYLRISAALEQQLLAEEGNLQAMRESLHRMEVQILRRLWQTGQRGGM